MSGNRGSGGRTGSESESYQDLLHCMICFDNYRDPKMLKCGHSFCGECLEGYLTTYKQQKKSQTGKLPCPTCRELTTLPVAGIKALRNDFRIKKIEEMFRTVNLRENKVSKQNCESCKSQKKSAKALFYCANCSINYCDSCTKKHNKNPIFKNHQMIDKSEQTSTDALCSVHKGEHVKFFCRSCQRAACTLCVVNAHERHDVMDLTDALKSHRGDIESLLRSVETKIQQLNEREKELNDIRNASLAACEQAELAIKERTQELLEEIRAQEKSLLKELSERREAKVKRIGADIDRLTYQLAKACSLQEFASGTAKRNLDYKNNMRLMAIHEELIERMRTVGDVELGNNDHTLHNITTFLPGRQEPKVGRLEELEGTASMLHKTVVAKIPSQKVSAKRILSSDTAVREDIERAAMAEDPKLILHIKKVGSGKNEIRDPVGAACLPNGNIVVAEWGNKRLHVFDSTGTSVSIIGSQQIEPQGVAVTQMGNIMVADENNKRIEVFHEKGKSLAKWGLGHLFCPCGIAMSPNGNCVITDIAEHAVSIFESENKVIKRFGTRGKGNLQFNNPLYVAIGPNSDIYVSDSDNHCIKVFNDEGQFQFKFGSEGTGDGQFKYPRGVTYHPDGYVIVADRNNNRVTMFSSTGRFIRHVLTREYGIKDPYAVVVTPAKNILVTESAKGRASVKVFQMHS